MGGGRVDGWWGLLGRRRRRVSDAWPRGRTTYSVFLGAISTAQAMTLSRFNEYTTKTPTTSRQLHLVTASTFFRSVSSPYSGKKSIASRRLPVRRSHSTPATRSRLMLTIIIDELEVCSYQSAADGATLYLLRARCSGAGDSPHTLTSPRKWAAGLPHQRVVVAVRRTLAADCKKSSKCATDTSATTPTIECRTMALTYTPPIQGQSKAQSKAH